MLSELPFYQELNLIKTNSAFRRYAIRSKVEIHGGKDSIKQLEASTLRIKDLRSDPLNETKSFKSQMTLKVVLTKYKSTEIEFDPLLQKIKKYLLRIHHFVSTRSIIKL